VSLDTVRKEVIAAKILARDLQEAAERNLKRNDKFINVLFDPNASLEDKYKAFYKLCGGEKLKKIENEAIAKLDEIYFCYTTLDRLSKKKENEQKSKFENKKHILKTRFNELLLRMLKVAFPEVAKTLWGIRGIGLEPKKSESGWEEEE